jgi:bacteriorhodopsin
LANASIVGLVVFAVLERFLRPYSDADIQASLVDTYEASAWGFLVVCVVGLVGIAAAALVRFVGHSPVRRRIAVLQVVLLLACIALAGWQHHSLMKRTTELTGQTFEGFP